MATHPSGPEPLLKKMKRGQTIHQFMAEWGPFDIDKCHELIERLIRFLKENVPINVSKVVKGGCTGKNTIVFTPCHVELYVFINDLSSVQDMKSKTRRILDIIRAKLDSSEFVPRYGVIQFIDYTPHSMTFHLNCQDLGQQHIMEVFPAFDVLKYKNVHDVYKDMSELPDADRDCYSVCLAEMQIDFIRQAPSQVRSLIRILKYWLKEEVNVDVKITSYYLMELLVMHRWQRAGQPSDFDMFDWFEEIMIQLYDLESLGIEWEKVYTTTKYRAIPPRPFVMDPANPFNNVLPEPRYRQQLMRCAKAVVGRSRALRKYLNHGSAPIIEGMGRGQTLQQFIQDTVQPSSDDRRKCDHLVDRLTYFLQHHTRLSVNMVVRGGSLGKSTNVLGKSDVDLVVFVNNVKSLQDLATKMSILLNSLQDALDSKWTEFAGYLEYVNRSDRGLQYNLSCGDNDHVHEVDIMPSFNILGAKSPLEVFSEMKPMTNDERRLYAACFSQKQVDFVKQTPIKVKNLIRLVKYWAKVEVNIKDKAVTSFFLELLVISHWMNNASPSDFSTMDWFREIMTQLTDLTSLRILWPEQYDAASFCVFRENPVVLDPTNPYINVAPRRKHHSLVMTCAQNVLYRMQAWENYRTGRYPDS